jgi:prolyl-tRNA editing enzyme YbaK/EbsC (Cys-tRNA(Pro) deacylase)
VIADPDNPGSWLRHFSLPYSVASCASAAEAKGIALAHELKTLILDCDRGLALAHLRGDHRLSLRAAKRALQVREAKLADVSRLTAIGLQAGTVQPFGPSLWGLPHLISGEVLKLPWITTNAGQDDTFIVFDPVLLLRAKHTVVGQFEVN